MTVKDGEITLTLLVDHCAAISRACIAASRATEVTETAMCSDIASWQTWGVFFQACAMLAFAQRLMPPAEAEA